VSFCDSGKCGFTYFTKIGFDRVFEIKGNKLGFFDFEEDFCFLFKIDYPYTGTYNS
jgi:hypothetical protein